MIADLDHGTSASPGTPGSPARPILGTLLLSGIGAIVGGLIGTTLLALLPLIWNPAPPTRSHIDLLFSLVWGGSYGAVIGAIVAPLAGWTLVRRVPLGRAIGGTAAGTVIGALLVLPQPLIGGVIGYMAAAIILNRTYRKRALAG